MEPFIASPERFGLIHRGVVWLLTLQMFRTTASVVQDH